MNRLFGDMMTSVLVALVSDESESDVEFDVGRGSFGGC